MIDLSLKPFLGDNVIGESPPHWDAWEMEGGCMHTCMKTILRSDVIWKRYLSLVDLSLTPILCDNLASESPQH